MRSLLVRLGLATPADAAKVASVPLCAVCAGYPLIIPPLMAAGVISSGATLHVFLPILAPINLWLLRASLREHGKPLAVILAAASIPFILAHMAGHFFFGGDDLVLLALIWIGGGLLVGALLLDWQAQRSLAHVGNCATPEGYWYSILTGDHPGLRRGRDFFARLPGSPRCKLCHAPFGGPLVPLMRLLGKGRSTKNPRFCSDCLAKAPLGGAEVELSLLFADVRGSTSLAEGLRPADFAARMNRFYAVGSEALIRTDALIDKFMGDEIIGLYPPGFAGPHHARQAVEAARQLLRATGHGDPDGPWLPIGIGVHTGVAYMGAVGSEGTVSDVTVLGDAANTAARLASAAGPGEVLVSAAACAAADLDCTGAEARQLHLKGRSEPVDVWVLRASETQPALTSR